MLTKRLLKESLMRLMEEKPVQKISVSELCREAGLNRVTFYNHYNSPIELLKEMECDMVKDIHTVLRQGGLESNSPMNKRLEAVCTYLRANEQKAKLLFQNNSSESEFAVNLFRIPHIWDNVRSKLSDAYGEDGMELLLTFIIQGTYGMMRRWLLDDIGKTPREMGELFAGVYIKEYLGLGID